MENHELALSSDRLDLGSLSSIGLCSLAGALAGFGAGLVPGLHMNNIAAAITAYSGATMAAFGALGSVFGAADSPVLISCFLSAALVGHLFAESITSTYLGIPAGDVVSVLPAHRLARAGLGELAVKASADGSLFGVLVASLLLLPTSLVMGQPMNLYECLSRVMGFAIMFVSAILLYTEGWGRPRGRRAVQVIKAALLFGASGILGTVVLCTDFCACRIPDFPVDGRGFVERSSLMLPMFAGLYGVPGLLLGLKSMAVMEIDHGDVEYPSRPASKKDMVVSVLGGCLVGWMPGMTAGASATVCSPSVREASGGTDMRESVRFIWLYSSISSAGAVFALGALFVILRARSGCMDAAQYFLGDRIVQSMEDGDAELIAVMLTAMLVAAVLGHLMVTILNPRLGRLRATLCSSQLAITSLAFVCSLSLVLTGTRGGLVLATSSCLGLLAPLAGVRRIQLMGCLLVPIMLKYFGAA